MTTREEKVQLIAELKTQAEICRSELQEISRKRKRGFFLGSLLRLGILLLVVSVGVCVAAVFILRT